MGDPREVPEAYATSGAIEDAVKIADPLLLIHGMADDNVVFENSSELIAKLQGNNVPFEMMLYPGFTHRVGGEKVSPHLWNAIRSEEHQSELQSLMRIQYAAFCLQKTTVQQFEYTTRPSTRNQQLYRLHTNTYEIYN